MIVARPSYALTMLMLLIPALVIAQDSEPTKAGSEEQTVERKLIDRTFSDMKVYFGDTSTNPMESRIVLRWPNPVRHTEHGATAIFIEKGRPQAVCCVWTERGSLSFCFGLLSSGPVRAELDGEPLWHPRTRGPSVTHFRSIPDAPAPAKTASMRLRQMKDLAQRFGSKMVEPQTGSHEPLRLLPSALYRYDLAAEQGKSILKTGGHTETVVAVQ
jgi:hypothetical protein